LWYGLFSAVCSAMFPSAEPPIPSTTTFSKRPATDAA
jgi:hypothetical protein